MTTLIGFSGRKFAGKNTCAEVLADLILDEYFKKSVMLPDEIVKLYSFADPMKRTCRKFFGLTNAQCYGTNDDKNTPTIVQWENFPAPPSLKTTQLGGITHGYLPFIDAQTHQLTATTRKSGPMTAREVLQYFGTEVLRTMEPNAHVRALLSDIEEDLPLFALITDVRFPNEVAAIQEQEGKVIRLTRVMYPEDTHESETALDVLNYDWVHFDYILDNTNISLKHQETILHTVAKAWKLI